jgi:predicted DNA-binding transcriptional regulator YafY
VRRSERLFEIVQILRRSRGPTTAQTIANELETSQRSIYRDIAALVAQRVPIRGEAGIGYVIDRDFDMPPLMLTSDELDAVVLGASWVASRGEPELARAAQDLIAKIEAVVPPALRTHLLEPSTSIAPPVAPRGERVSSSELRAAIRRGRKVALRYCNGAGVETDRVVWPVLLGYRDAGRILAAWCELRQAFRYFRTDRMAAARILEERVPERLPLLRARWQVAMEAERAKYALSGTS